MNRSVCQPSRRGFTYIELALSLTISSILLLGLTSVILIGSRAIPTGTEQIHTEASVGEVFALMTEDLELATNFTLQSPRSFTVIVPDRDGDSLPEQIRYAMTAVPGSLNVKWNNGAWTVVIDRVDEMDIRVIQSDDKILWVGIDLVIPDLVDPTQAVQAELFNLPGRN